jgi:hypothetical protein
MCDIDRMFRAISCALYNKVDNQESIIKHIIYEADLDGRDAHTALRAGMMTPWKGLDYEEAYMVLGKKYVDEWIEYGTFTDKFDPLVYENFNYWSNPTLRQMYYEEYLAHNSRLRRSGSVCTTRLHPNFTIAEIEHAVRNAMQ